MACLTTVDDVALADGEEIQLSGFPEEYLSWLEIGGPKKGGHTPGTKMGLRATTSPLLLGANRIDFDPGRLLTQKRGNATSVGGGGRFLDSSRELTNAVGHPAAGLRGGEYIYISWLWSGTA